MSESERHREIRERILNDFEGGAELYSSHTGKGDIAFFKDEIGSHSALSYPDVLICKDGRTLIIEIETGNKPKLLLGVASANYHSNIGKQNNELIDISRKSLLIVLPSLEIDKKGSGKPRQISKVKELIQKQLDYEFIDIVTELKVHDIINEWLKGVI